MAETARTLPAVPETCQARSPGWEDSLEKGMATARVSIFPGEFHGRRGQGGCSRCGREESDAAERLTLSLSEQLRAADPVLEVLLCRRSVFPEKLG